MATEIFVGHWDGYSPTRNNWVMHVDGDGRLSLQPWGTDQCFDRNLDLYSGQGRIFQYCMTDAPCRAAYETRMGRVLEALDALDLEARARAVFEVIAPEVDTDTRERRPRRRWVSLRDGLRAQRPDDQPRRGGRLSRRH